MSPVNVGLRDGLIGLAEEQRLDVPDCVPAADIPQEPARVPGVPAARGAFFHHKHAGARVMRGDSRAGPSRAASDDQYIDLSCTVHVPDAIPGSAGGCGDTSRTLL